MRWEDEQFVKVYTRDTGDWIALGWEAQSLLLLMLRKVDRAGLLHVGKSRLRGLAGMTGMPVEVVSRALPLLLEDGCVQECDAGYLITNFIVAQEARQTDRARKAMQRQKDRDIASSQGIKQASVADILSENQRRESHDVTPAVTSGHTMSHAVTLRRDESRRDETTDPPPASQAAPRNELRLEPQEQPRRRRAREEKPTDPRHRPLLEQLVAQGWELGGPRGARAVADLLARAGEATPPTEAPREVLRRAGHALQKRRTAPTLFPAVAELWELVTHWQHFAEPFRAPAGRGPAPPSDFEAPRPYVEPAWLDPNFGKE